MFDSFTQVIQTNCGRDKSGLLPQSQHKIEMGMFKAPRSIEIFEIRESICPPKSRWPIRSSGTDQDQSRQVGKSRGIKKCRDNLNFPQFLDSTRPFSFNFEGFQEQCLLLIMKILTIPIILVLKVGENREVR